MKRSISFVSVLVYLCSVQANPLYKAIKMVPFDGHGWFKHQNKAMLTKFIVEKKPMIVVEVGSWLGLSTRHIAKQLLPGSVVYAIDTWQGSLHESAHQNDPRVKNKKLFHIFLSNVCHEKLEDKIVPIRMSSLEAAESLAIKPQLVYIDASHVEEDVYNDIIAWYAKLDEGGIMCGDDWMPSGWASVVRAVKRAADTLHCTVNNEGPFWWYT